MIRQLDIMCELKLLLYCTVSKTSKRVRNCDILHLQTFVLYYRFQITVRDLVKYSEFVTDLI
jgi:hypothetical protein